MKSKENATNASAPALTPVGRVRLVQPSRRSATIVQITMGYVSVALSIGQGIVLVPLYLRHIDARLYGLWLATGGITVWLGMLDFGVSGLMGQRIAAAYGRKDCVAIGLYFFNGLLLQAFLVLLVLGAATCVAWKLPELLHATTAEVSVLRRATFLACLATACTFLNYGQKNTADALQRPLGPMIGLTVGGIITIVTIVLLLQRGHGLMALPIGMLAGSLLSLAANFCQVAVLVKQAGGRLAFDWSILIEMLKLSPALFGARIGGALVSRIEPMLVLLFVAPEMAVAFALTKRAAEIGQTLTDRIGGAVTAGFAHLYAEGERAKVTRVLRTIVLMCLACGVLSLGVYLACNRSFVELWIGSQHYAGDAVTFLLVPSILSLVFGNLFSVLLGATGDIAAPSWMQLAEAVVRLLLMGGFLLWFGLAGLPLAVLVSTGLFSIWYGRRLRRRLAMEQPFISLRTVMLSVVVLVFAALIGRWWHPANWASCVGCGVTVAVLIGLILWVGDPQLRLLKNLRSSGA